VLWGAEVDAVASLTDRLFLSGDVSFIRGTQTPAPELGIHSENLAEIPPLRSRLQLRFDNGSYYWSVEGVLSSTQDNVNTDLQEEETPGYATANLRLGMRRDRFLITVGLDNLFDKAYFEHLSYYRDPFRSGVRVLEPGRNFFVNVSYRF
jgi:iron complex outermembrane receptor protein